MKEDSISEREACWKYELPMSTFRRYLLEGKIIKSKLGKKPSLTPGQEAELSSLVVGYPQKTLQIDS